ncbi:hypothetical protein ABE583_11750 [Stenotrophomonas sp. TWI143]|uniref:hypothetical protein n=1 Tax=Stenotrophomonas sp. TWI143 TaxID=3136771 RepID=UPI0029888CE0|nr:hypothetical protein [Stenotrophomonas maltophilia]HDS1231760.1 hypothetical protein [Stenotrophomonas maltophilia]HEL3864219.1 hypothetical protein [Stenotrophomonas maltophilia]HEL4288028.1 hypothetical protein [Stenotrophomonas maltophilia]
MKAFKSENAKQLLSDPKRSAQLRDLLVKGAELDDFLSGSRLVHEGAGVRASREVQKSLTHALQANRANIAEIQRQLQQLQAELEKLRSRAEARTSKASSSSQSASRREPDVSELDRIGERLQAVRNVLNK